MNQDVVTIQRTGQIQVNPQDPEREDSYLPSECNQNHAANILPLPNGDLLCVWFGGTQEGIADISIYMSRLAKGENHWSPADKLSEDPTRSEQNPILFLAPDQTLWLIYTAQVSGNQDTAIVRYRQSQDMGHTWSPIATLLDKPGTFVRQPPVVLDNGDWLLPVFYCDVKPGEKWAGNYDTSGIKISSDQGKTWADHPIPDSLGCVHMNIVPLKNGQLMALYRSRWADNIYQSYSTDGGRHWTKPVATELPNNNSSIQATTLENGHIALVYNHMSRAGATERRLSLYDEIEDDGQTSQSKEIPIDSEAKMAFWGAPRAPMSLAISTDNGKSWAYRRDLEVGDGYCMTNNSTDKRNREFSYPSIKQGTDGKLHIAFTYFRQAIKYVCVDESWATK